MKKLQLKNWGGKYASPKPFSHKWIFFICHGHPVVKKYSTPSSMCTGREEEYTLRESYNWT